MTLFDFIKRIANIHSDPSTPEGYQKMREFEREWLESHYDFNSIAGINAIPVSKRLKRPPTSGVTGEVYYYLRHKAYQHEEDHNIELAIACLRKSNELLWISKYAGTDNQCYALIKMLARAGYVDRAHKEKTALDRYCSNRPVHFDIPDDSIIDIEAKRGQEARDFKWLQENLPDKCPTSISGYRRMKTQNTKNYQTLKKLAADLGREI